MRVRLDEQVGHKVHDVAARKVGASILVVRLREALDEIFEDIAHIHRTDFIGRHIGLRLAEVADNLVEQWGIRVGEAFDLVGELHARQDVLHVVREPVDVVLEVILDVLWVGLKCLEGELRGVVKGVSRGFAQKAVLHGKRLVFLSSGENSIVCGSETIMKALDDGHRKDNQAVLMRLVGTAQGVGSAPDKGCLLLNISANGLDEIVAVCHRYFSFLDRYSMRLVFTRDVTLTPLRAAASLAASRMFLGMRTVTATFSPSTRKLLSSLGVASPSIRSASFMGTSAIACCNTNVPLILAKD